MSEQIEIHVVPLPKSVHIEQGTRSLRHTVVHALHSSLAPLAPIFEQELEAVLGERTGTGNETRTIVELNLDEAMREEQIKIAVAEKVQIVGGSYSAVAGGTAVLLQLMSNEGELPLCTVEDEPDLPYRGLMMDLGRHWHSTDCIRQTITFCRFYRFSHLHLHLTDDPLFTFPLRSFPQIPVSGMKYTRQELEDLIEYAQRCGVQLVPEIDLPGHSRQLNLSEPELFTSGIGEAHENAICLGNPAVLNAVQQMLRELCEIFKYSKYIHLGCDETKLEIFEQCPCCREKMKELNVNDAEGLLRDFIVRAAEIVREQGRQPIVWEGFSPAQGIEIPKDIVVIPWESYYHPADSLAEAGYALINASWQPLYATPTLKWSPEHIYGWHVRRWEHWWDQSKATLQPIELDESANLLGAQFCSWENEESAELELIRLRAPTMVERVWNVVRREEWPSFAKRLEASDRRLLQVLSGKPEQVKKVQKEA